MVTEQNGSILNGLGSHQSFDEYGNGDDGYQHTHDYVSTKGQTLMQQPPIQIQESNLEGRTGLRT